MVAVRSGLGAWCTVFYCIINQSDRQHTKRGRSPIRCPKQESATDRAAAGRQVTPHDVRSGVRSGSRSGRRPTRAAPRSVRAQRGHHDSHAHPSSCWRRWALIFEPFLSSLEKLSTLTLEYQSQDILNWTKTFCSCKLKYIVLVMCMYSTVSYVLASFSMPWNWQ